MRKTAVIFVCLVVLVGVVIGQDEDKKSKDDLKKSKKFTKLGKKPVKLKSSTVDPDDIDTFEADDDTAEVTSEQTVSTTRAPPVEPQNAKSILKQDLLKYYNKADHPVKDWQNAVQVG